MATIYRPCYATRLEVMNALDVKQAAYAASRVDRAIQSGADAVDDLCQRRFYFADETHNWDWPNYQYAFPWRVWFNENELADVTVTVPTVVSGGVNIPSNTILWGDPENPVAPFTYLELNRSSSSSFGNGPTPQREISITGTYGYWLKTTTAGSLAAGIADTTSTQITVSRGDTPGVGDVMIVDSERMLVVDQDYSSTGIVPSSGGQTAKASDNTIAVANGTLFTKGEVLLWDSEWLLLEAIYGNNLVVKRAFGGSVLGTHSTNPLWAQRLLTVQRGALGSTAATHNNSAGITISVPPGLVKQLNVAYAIVSLSDEPQGFATISGNAIASGGVGGTGRNRAREPQVGVGLPGLEDRVIRGFARSARSAVI